MVKSVDWAAALEDIEARILKLQGLADGIREIAITDGTEAQRPRNVVSMGSRRKNPAAVALGRKGGIRSAAGRMEKIPPDERRRIASVAARARWAK